MSDKTNPGEFKALRRMNRDVRQIKKSKHATKSVIDPRIADLIRTLAHMDVFPSDDALDKLIWATNAASDLLSLIGGQS